MKLFGFALVSAQYVTTLQTLNESLSVDNQNLAGQLNAVKAELAREQSNHNRALESNTNLKQGFELLEKKYQAEIEVLNRELQELRDQKAEIEQERVEAMNRAELAETISKKWENNFYNIRQKYDQQNQTLAEIIGPWKQKVQKLQGRLGAYVKKYGDLPHKREEQRKRKESLTKPSQGEGC